MVQEEIKESTTHLATKADIADTKAYVNDVKADIIKWMFIFWSSNLLAMAGLMYALLK